MRRLAVLIAVAVLLGAAALLARRWWTRPPAAPAGRLAARAAAVPADADGLLVLAEPARAARYLAAHPPALALVWTAAPRAERGLRRLAPALATLAAAATSELSIWWRAEDAAAEAAIRADAIPDLRDACSARGLRLDIGHPSGEPAVVRVATAADLLAGEPGPATPPAGAAVAAGLARVGPRWWWVLASRRSLEVATGAPLELPPLARPGRFATSDLAALLGPAILGTATGPVAARAALDGADWALALPGVHPSRAVTRLLSLAGDEPAAAPPGARRWRGALGELWALPGAGVALATRPDLLALVATAEGGDEAAFTGADAAALAGHLAARLDTVEALGVPARELREAARQAGGVAGVRWRLTPAGGRVRLEW